MPGIYNRSQMIAPGKILKLKTAHNKYLLPAMEAIWIENKTTGLRKNILMPEKSKKNICRKKSIIKKFCKECITIKAPIKSAFIKFGLVVRGFFQDKDYNGFLI